jgi:hypothetical protein
MGVSIVIKIVLRLNRDYCCTLMKKTTDYTKSTQVRLTHL